MDSIQVTTYQMNTRLGLRLALVTDLHSMPYDEGILWNAMKKEKASGISFQWNSGSFCRR